MSEYGARISAAAGDAAALLALTIELAEAVARLKVIETAEQERKRAAADKKYRQRHGTSRDVPGQTGTGGDMEGPPPAGKEKGFIWSPPDTPNGVSRPAPRRARPRPPAESWVAEGVALWGSIVGSVPHGEFGAALKPMIALHGWPAVRPDLEKWLRERAAIGKPCRPAWYAGEVTARLAPKPPMVNEHGELTEYGERMSRPDKVPA